MTVSQIERRLAALEEEVAKLKAKPAKQNDWWNKIAGIFANDPLAEEAMRYGREWREEEPSPGRRNVKERKSGRGKRK